MKVASVKQIRKIENIAISELGIPSIVLMENAAIGVARRCLDYLKAFREPKAVVIAGPGLNGGDGMAVARHLYMNKVDVGVILIGDELSIKNDAKINFDIIKKMGIPVVTITANDNMLDIPYTIETCDLVVDALFGIGFGRRPEGVYEYVIEMINSYAKYVVSVDMPSGIDSNAGHLLGAAVKADETVTFIMPKLGAILYPGKEYIGKLTIEDISLPLSVIGDPDINTEIMDDADAGKLLPKRLNSSNKGTYGKTYVFAGCNEMPGAAVLTCRAVYKAGGGLVRACVVQNVAAVIQQEATEVVTKILPDKAGHLHKRSLDAMEDNCNEADVVIAGPGLGRSAGVTEFIAELINRVDAPMILDADALYAVAEDVDILDCLKQPGVITPHPGEMSRLTGLTIGEILQDTINVALSFAQKHDVVTVLKDARTIVASPSGQIYINVTGNSALSKAGSGDVLTGMIGAFAAQGLDAYSAAVLAVYMHGRAGELAGESLSLYGVNATDLLEYLPLVFKKLSASNEQK